VIHQNPIRKATQNVPSLDRGLTLFSFQRQALLAEIPLDGCFRVLPVGRSLAGVPAVAGDAFSGVNYGHASFPFLVNILKNGSSSGMYCLVSG
jgi:hypothetical protein